jgi:hypothetical protein
MRNTWVWLSVVVATAAWGETAAKPGAVSLIAGNECVGFMAGLVATVDGQVGSSTRFEGLSPGVHQVSATCFRGFTSEVLATKDLDIPAGMELRLRVKGKDLELVGQGPVLPRPAPVVAAGALRAPSREALQQADEFLDEAESDTRRLQKFLRDESDRCVLKVSTRLELVVEALGGKTGLPTVDAARTRVEEARVAADRCGKGLAQDINADLDRVAKSVSRAERVLR